MKRIVIFISGRGSNMQAIVESSRTGILKDRCEILTVISDRENAGGISISRSLGIPVKCIASAGKTREAFEKEIVSFLKPISPDYIVLAGFRRVLSPLLIGHYRNRIINIHPADPTLFRGLNGYQWAFEKKLRTTLITVHFVDEGVDTGRIIAQKEIDLTGKKTLEEIEKIGLQTEHEFYPSVLAEIFRETDPAETQKT